jgi:hypothetical protein
VHRAESNQETRTFGALFIRELLVSEAKVTRKNNFFLQNGWTYRVKRRRALTWELDFAKRNLATDEHR